jgi:hypothetical protein
MFMSSPVSAAELSDVSGNGTPWMLGGSSDENIAEGNVMHGDIAAASQTARAVAERIAAALGHATLPAGESDTTGRVAQPFSRNDCLTTTQVELSSSRGWRVQERQTKRG